MINDNKACHYNNKVLVSKGRCIEEDLLKDFGIDVSTVEKELKEKWVLCFFIQ